MKNSMAPMTATYGRIGMVTGRGMSQILRSGKRIALAMSMPKIAPEAPIVGISEGVCPQNSGINFTIISINPAPTPQTIKKFRKSPFAPTRFEIATEHPEHQHVDQNVPEVAMQENVGKRLPDA